MPKCINSLSNERMREKLHLGTSQHKHKENHRQRRRCSRSHRWRRFCLLLTQKNSKLAEKVVAKMWRKLPQQLPDTTRWQQEWLVAWMVGWLVAWLHRNAMPRQVATVALLTHLLAHTRQVDCGNCNWKTAQGSCQHSDGKAFRTTDRQRDRQTLGHLDSFCI